MDYMIGTIDAKRLRRDLLQMYRTSANRKSPAVRNMIYMAEQANEQELVSLAKREGIDLRKYIR